MTELVVSAVCRPAPRLGRRTTTGGDGACKSCGFEATRLTRAVAVVAFGLLIACSGDGSAVGGSDVAPDEAGQSLSDSGADTDAETDSGVVDGPDRVEELARRWADQRDEVVKGLRSQGYGLPGFARSGDTAGAGGESDDSDADTDTDPDSEDTLTIRGPGRFRFDLGQCPGDWSDTAGISRSAISLAVVPPTTGDQARFGQLAAGMRAYFDYVNARGGVGGRQLELDARDDGYEVGITEDMVDSLLDSDEQLLAVTTFGTANSLAVYQDLNRTCVPHPFVMSAHPAWGDPVRHNPAEPDVSEAMASLAGDPVDVLLIMTAGRACSSALSEAAATDAVVDGGATFLPSVCKHPDRYLLPTGLAADGVRLVDGGVKALAGPRHADEGFEARVWAVLEEANVDDPSGLAATGVGQYAWALCRSPENRLRTRRGAPAVQPTVGATQSGSRPPAAG